MYYLIQKKVLRKRYNLRAKMLKKSERKFRKRNTFDNDDSFQRKYILPRFLMDEINDTCCVFGTILSV